MSAADSFNKINQTGNSSILTYDDIQTRSLDSIRIGNFCGKFLNLFNNVFIGDTAGLIAKDVENSILIGHNAGDNITNGNKVIIIGYNYNNSNYNNSITIGENYTESYSTSIGNNNFNYGQSNVIIGYNSSNIGNNLFTIGNDLIIKASKVFYHNGFNDPSLTNISFNPKLNLFYNNYSQIYSNSYNTINNLNQINTIIQIQRKNLLNDFILPFLKKDCLIIQSDHYVLYNSNIQVPSIPTTINFTNNQIFNLTNNTNSNLIVPLSIIKRVAIPILNPSSREVSFNQNDGFILNNNDYQL